MSDDLLRQLNESDRQAAAKTIQALVSRGPAIVPKVLTGLNHPSEWVRLNAATLLGDLEATEAVPALIELLHDPEFIVREAAVTALAAIGDPRAIDPLIDRLHDSWHDVRQAAAYVLGQFGDERVVWPLVEALADEDYEVQDNAIGALQELGPLAINQLEQIVQKGDSAQRVAAQNALDEIRAG